MKLHTWSGEGERERRREGGRGKRICGQQRNSDSAAAVASVRPAAPGSGGCACASSCHTWSPNYVASRGPTKHTRRQAGSRVVGSSSVPLQKVERRRERPSPNSGPPRAVVTVRVGTAIGCDRELEQPLSKCGGVAASHAAQLSNRGQRGEEASTVIVVSGAGWTDGRMDGRGTTKSREYGSLAAAVRPPHEWGNRFADAAFAARIISQATPPINPATIIGRPNERTHECERFIINQSLPSLKPIRRAGGAGGREGQQQAAGYHTNHLRRRAVFGFGAFGSKGREGERERGGEGGRGRERNLLI